MKSWVINILLLLATCTAVFCFTRKFDAPTDPDKLRVALSGLKPYLSPGQHIVFKSDAPEADVNLLAINYFFAPVNLDTHWKGPNDTTLLLLQPNVSNRDTAIAALLRRSSVIWQQKDDKYEYMLIHHS